MKACNCDADDEKWLYDEGVITDTEALPIIEVRYGDVTTEMGEKGQSSVGPLRCQWDKTMAVKSCEEVAQAGVRQSGPYMIDPDGPLGPVPPQEKYCEFMHEAYAFMHSFYTCLHIQVCIFLCIYDALLIIV